MKASWYKAIGLIAAILTILVSLFTVPQWLPGVRYSVDVPVWAILTASLALLGVSLYASSLLRWRLPSRSERQRQIKRDLEDAELQIVFIGGFPSSLLNVDTFDVLARVLDARPKLRLTVVYESRAELINRAIYLENPLGSGSRRYLEDLLKKRLDLTNLKSQVLSRCVAADSTSSRDHMAARISVAESKAQNHLTIAQIDDVMYVNPISHRRNSQSPCFRLTPRHGSLYDLASEYVDFHLETMTWDSSVDPSKEICHATGVDGLPIAYAPRGLRYGPSIGLEVVWALVLDRKARVLLQQRGPEADDNVGKWDKSVGGHLSARRDSTAVDCVRNELNEELSFENIRVDDLMDSGEWPGASGRVDLRPSRGVILRLSRVPDYASTRDSGLMKTMCVTIYAVVLPSFGEVRPRRGQSSAVKWVECGELPTAIGSEDGRSQYTQDLVDLCSMPVYSLLEEVATAARAAEEEVPRD